MLPLAQQHSTALQGGATRYIQRRAWRILPSYYAVLLLSLGLIALVPILQAPHNTAWDTKLPITAGSIVAHLLLVHNFSPDWIFKIDGPMWSIAIEWQIYFLFPAVLLPVLRRSSMAVTVGLAMLLGLLPHFVLPNALNIDYTHPWFVGLFAFGMAAAALAYSSHPAVALPHARRRWGRLIALLTLALAAGLALNKQWMEWHAYITEPVAGLIVAYWLIEYTRALRDGTRRPFSQRLLESRMLVGLGAFSYSLYLVHNPIQALINLESLKLAMPADARLALMLGVATPLSLLCAYGFYLLVERRCLRMNERVTPDGDA
jgi:peptidoglycan/LPS O-acetylase OafA/YrhL